MKAKPIRMWALTKNGKRITVDTDPHKLVYDIAVRFDKRPKFGYLQAWTMGYRVVPVIVQEVEK